VADGVRAPWRPVGVQETTPLRMVTLRVLADKDYLALARTCAMHIGAVLGFPLTRVTDLRLAVNEACLCFLDTAFLDTAFLDTTTRDKTRLDNTRLNSAEPRKVPGLGRCSAPGTLELAYDLYPTELHVTVRAEVPEGWPRVDETGWALLRALVGDVRVEAHEGLGALTLVEQLPARTG
jgi:hypothetical protein